MNIWCIMQVNPNDLRDYVFRKYQPFHFLPDLRKNQPIWTKTAAIVAQEMLIQHIWKQPAYWLNILC